MMKRWHELTGDSFSTAATVPLNTYNRYVEYDNIEQQMKATQENSNG